MKEYVNSGFKIFFWISVIVAVSLVISAIVKFFGGLFRSRKEAEIQAERMAEKIIPAAKKEDLKLKEEIKSEIRKAGYLSSPVPDYTFSIRQFFTEKIWNKIFQKVK